jgi:flagellar P-ring protein precursor FlgI
VQAAPAHHEAPINTLHSIRIKDVADVLGVRENQLVGQGLVVGLEGSGDKSGNVTQQALANLISRSGINVLPAAVKPKNIALVAVTATLPPFSKKGAKIDVQVSSMGDALSLQGGILLQTPLNGADGRVYAVAQGALSIGGFSVGDGGASIQKNHLLVGRVPNGALVEREVATEFQRNGIVSIVLRQADFTTAQRVADAINKRWPNSSRAIDPYSIQFQMPFTAESLIPVAILSELESLRFVPDMRAKVAINERTGTIVAGANVKLAPTVLSHGGLVLTIKRTSQVSQPEGFSNGRTVLTGDTTATATEEGGAAIVFEHGPTLGDLAAALNALKVKPRDIIAIFQALKEAGALNAELVIM